MSEMIRVVLADDHVFMRTGIRAFLTTEPDILVVGEAADRDAVQHVCEELQPDVLLLDLSMPGSLLSTTLSYLSMQCPTMKILVLSAYDDEEYIRRVAPFGVMGYVLKDEPPEALVQAIHTMVQGGMWFSQRIRDKLMQWGTSERNLFKDVALTEREKEMLLLVAHSKSDKEIGEAVGLAERSVRKELRTIYDKLNVNDRLEAAVWSVQQGLF